MKSRAEIRTDDAEELSRRDRRWRGAAEIANVILDDDTIKANSLDVHVSQVNGLGNFMAYVQMDSTLTFERLTHLMKLAELYDFEVVVLSQHDGEGRYNLRLWPK